MISRATYVEYAFPSQSLTEIREHSRHAGSATTNGNYQPDKTVDYPRHRRDENIVGKRDSPKEPDNGAECRNEKNRQKKQEWPLPCELTPRPPNAKIVYGVAKQASRALHHYDPP